MSFDEGRLKRIDAFVEKQVREGRVAGMAVNVLHGAKLVHSAISGAQDEENKIDMSTNTIFRIYSMTKPITSVALMMLYEQGLFNLDDPISKFAPMFTDMRVAVGGTHPTIDTVAAATPITFEHVLTHTTGFTYAFVPDEYGVNKFYDENNIHFNALESQSRVPVTSLRETCTRLATAPLLFHPGTKWTYGVSTDVAGYLVEVISGMPFADYVVEHICKPLCMVDTDFWVPEEKRARFAACYIFNPAGSATPSAITNATTAVATAAKVNAAGGITPIPSAASSTSTTSGTSGTESSSSPVASERVRYYTRFPADHPYFAKPIGGSGGGGLVSTMADYTRFLRMLLNGGELEGVRLLGPRTVAFMMRNHLPGDLLAFGKPSVLNQNRPGVGFGLGFAVVVDPTRMPLLCEEGEAAWGGMASTAFFVDPRNNIAAVLMTQLVPSTAHPFRKTLRSLVYQAFMD